MEHVNWRSLRVRAGVLCTPCIGVVVGAGWSRVLLSDEALIERYSCHFEPARGLHLSYLACTGDDVA